MTRKPSLDRFPSCPAPFNLAAHVLGQSERLSDKVALVLMTANGAQRWTYAKLRAAILGTATGFLEMGLVPGDRVLLRLGHSVEFPIAFLAAVTVGLVPVPTSAQLTEAEITPILASLRPRLILREEGIACPETDMRMLYAEDLSKMQNLPPASFDLGDPNREGYIIFTSGTSGQPRAVIHAHRAIWARQMMMEGWYDLKEGDRLMHAGAFNWSFTLGTGLLDPWTVGATSLIPASGMAPTQLPLLMKRFDATLFAAVPGIYRQMLDAGSMPKLPKMRHGLVAGEKLPERLRLAWRQQTGCDLHEAFGMSECSTFISGSPAAPARAGSLGRAQPGRQVAIIGEDGPVAAETVGTIAVHRDDPGLMLGYLDAPEETQARFSGNWFMTGDQGSMDAQGEITYFGRTDDMMNAGGFRVSPIEVETVLNAFPEIEQSLVTDIEVKQDTRVIIAFYKAAAPICDASLANFVAGRLARYKQPRAFIHLATLPTSANGKLKRGALPRIYEALNGST